MRTSLPGSAQRNEPAPRIPATPAGLASDLTELSLDLGVDLAAFADELVGESEIERAARLDAARDMLATDPGLHAATVGIAALAVSALQAVGAAVAGPGPIAYVYAARPLVDTALPTLAEIRAELTAADAAGAEYGWGTAA
ncbi:hypothetical protein [Kitasatospora cineracea]|uniref:Uncharacterized protein n=1 Tax=Kitasatospora cineracea TaxID=88074 RepID=A0A3N4RE34_9ACTN|nr:hypothetical protein [Kitasatospora cineracea]RPE26607.1 hypothetical protein EDD38_7668 [Kitasatospora cineracea]